MKYETGTTGIRRLIKAAQFSLQGLKAAWANEEAFRIEVVLTAILTPAAFWVGNTAFERALLIFSLSIVLIVELMNSAIEAIVDRVGLEHHELSGRAKDIGSAAVFIAVIANTTVWLIIFLG